MADTPAPASTVAAAPGGDAAPFALSPEKQLMDTLIFLVLLFFIFYFVLLRPQQQRAKAHQRLLATLQKGSRVVTGGGIIGTVQKMEADGVAVVEIAQGIKVRVASGTIAEVLPEGKPATGTANDN